MVVSEATLVAAATGVGRRQMDGVYVGDWNCWRDAEHDNGLFFVGGDVRKGHGLASMPDVPDDAVQLHRAVSLHWLRGCEAVVAAMLCGLDDDDAQEQIVSMLPDNDSVESPWASEAARGRGRGRGHNTAGDVPPTGARGDKGRARRSPPASEAGGVADADGEAAARAHNAPRAAPPRAQHAGARGQKKQRRKNSGSYPPRSAPASRQTAKAPECAHVTAKPGTGVFQPLYCRQH